MNLQVFGHLGGVPVHYDRYDESSGLGYGSRGKPFKPRATNQMIALLDACFTEIFAQTHRKLGLPQVITSAGAYVSKPGFHGKGEAFDLDGIFWKNTSLIAVQYPQKPHLYLAVESVLRQYFGTVLSYSYNTAHRDHFHIDLGSKVKFEKMSKSRVEYLQNSLFYIHGFQLGRDGVWGPETELVVKEAFNLLNIEGSLFSTEVWLSYLKITAEIGIELADI